MKTGAAGPQDVALRSLHVHITFESDVRWIMCRCDGHCMVWYDVEARRSRGMHRELQSGARAVLAHVALCGITLLPTITQRNAQATANAWSARARGHADMLANPRRSVTEGAVVWSWASNVLQFGNSRSEGA